MNCRGKLSNASLWLSGNRVALSLLAPGWFDNSPALITGNAKMHMWSQDYLHLVISNLKVHIELVLLEPHATLPFHSHFESDLLRSSEQFATRQVDPGTFLLSWRSTMPRTTDNQIYSSSYTRAVPCFAPRSACDSHNRRRVYSRSTQKLPLPV